MSSQMTLTQLKCEAIPRRKDTRDAFTQGFRIGSGHGWVILVDLMMFYRLVTLLIGNSFVHSCEVAHLCCNWGIWRLNHVCELWNDNRTNTRLIWSSPFSDDRVWLFSEVTHDSPSLRYDIRCQKYVNSPGETWERIDSRKLVMIIDCHAWRINICERVVHFSLNGPSSLLRVNLMTTQKPSKVLPSSAPTAQNKKDKIK